jgi:hypothetical protein
VSVATRSARPTALNAVLGFAGNGSAAAHDGAAASAGFAGRAEERGPPDLIISGGQLTSPGAGRGPKIAAAGAQRAPEKRGLPARHSPGARHPLSSTWNGNVRGNESACPISSSPRRKPGSIKSGPGRKTEPPLPEGEGHEPYERSECGSWGEGLRTLREARTYPSPFRGGWPAEAGRVGSHQPAPKPLQTLRISCRT